MARCRRVPAFETLTPSTLASSALSSPAWNFSAISSRSRAGSSASAARTAARRSACSASLVGRRRRRPRGSAPASRVRLRAAQLVERGVAGDAEQPRALAAAPASKRCALAVRALERQRGHVLGRRRGRAGASRRRRTRRRARPGRARRSRAPLARRPAAREVMAEFTPRTTRSASLHHAGGATRAARQREQARVVGDDARHAERLERADARAGRRPSRRTARRRRRSPRARGAASRARQWAMTASQRPARQVARRAAAAGGAGSRSHQRVAPGASSSHERCSRAARAGPTSRAGSRGASARTAARLRSIVEISARSIRPCSRSASTTRVLVAGQLEVDVELDAR